MILVESIFNKLNGTSTVIIKHKGEYFCGSAKLHPEDLENASKYTGCRFAEMRAEIKALKKDYKKAKASCEECRKFVKACIQYKNFDKESPTAKAIFRQLNMRIKQVNALADKINEKSMALEIAIKQKEIVHKALEKRKQQKAITK